MFIRFIPAEHLNITLVSRSQSYYVRLADHYCQLISGAVHLGDRLEAETEIAERFGVARGTVRRGPKLVVKDCWSASAQRRPAASRCPKSAPSWLA
jgi:DNA-binding FadR family transcriptional regulator